MTRLNYEHNGSKKLDSKMSLLSYRVSGLYTIQHFLSACLSECISKALWRGICIYRRVFSPSSLLLGGLQYAWAQNSLLYDFTLFAVD